jgi:uncharacterized protein involved in response to NO
LVILENALIASPMTQTIYAAVILAGLVRIYASLEPGWSDALLHVAAFAWCVVFFGLVLSFGPMLVEAADQTLGIVANVLFEKSAISVKRA